MGEGHYTTTILEEEKNTTHTPDLFLPHAFPDSSSVGDIQEGSPFYSC